MEADAALYKASRLEAAEAIYRRVLENWPNSYKALLGLGYLARDRGDQAAALAFFEAACMAAPGKTRPKLDAARTLRKLSRLDEAEALYESVLKDRPNLAAALVGLARVAQARGNVRSALACYQAAVASSPDREDLELKVALQLRKLSRLNEARNIYEGILARKPDHDVARARLQALEKPRKSGLPRMETSWLERPVFAHADEWGRNLEALRIPAFGLCLLTLAQDFAYGASEEVKPDCILIRRDHKRSRFCPSFRIGKHMTASSGVKQLRSRRPRPWALSQKGVLRAGRITQNSSRTIGSTCTSAKPSQKWLVPRSPNIVGKFECC